jgi:hypothetical protein
MAGFAAASLIFGQKSDLSMLTSGGIRMINREGIYLGPAKSGDTFFLSRAKNASIGVFSAS